MEESIKRQSEVVRMKLAGANDRAKVEGVDMLPGKTNYFISDDPMKWQTDVPTFARVKYVEVYPGIDLIFYGDHRQLEYDLTVAPGAEPDRITLGFDGAGSPRLNTQGDLVLRSAGGEVRIRKPVAYQEMNGVKQIIRARYVLKNGRRVGFQIAKYDRSQPLVIDPQIVYSTFLGGSDGDQGNSIAVDSQGNAYIAGQTNSLNYPTANPFQSSNAFRSPSAFVTKINAAGNALVYSTYLGGTGMSGSGQGASSGIAVDMAGNAYITGGDSSPDFPLVNPLQTSGSIFVTKLNTAGNALVYSTRFGGSNGNDSSNGIAVDSSGSVYITGQGGSTNFPTTTGAFQTVFGGFHDAFVTKFTPSGSALAYSTYIGGSGDDYGNAIAVDSSGNAYITGRTASSDLATIGAAQRSQVGDDAFIANLNATGSALNYFSYLGGRFSDEGRGIAVDSQGNAYVPFSYFCLIGHRTMWTSLSNPMLSYSRP